MLRNYCLRLWARINQKAVASETYLTNLGYFIIVTFPMFYLMNKYVIGIHGYESLFLRISIGFLGLVLVTIKYFPNSFKKSMPIILYSTLLYAFPFFFFFMLFNNPDSTMWKVNVLSGLFFLSFFLSWKEYLAFSVVDEGRSPSTVSRAGQSTTGVSSRAQSQLVINAQFRI